MHIKLIITALVHVLCVVLAQNLLMDKNATLFVLYTSNKDESYWTKGKWRDYLQQDQEQKQEQNIEQENNGEVTK